MKRIISLITVLTLTLSLTSCGGKVEEAHLKGYDEPFQEVYEEMFKEEIESSPENFGDYEMEWLDGWDHEKAPSEDKLGKGKKAVTFKHTGTFKYEGGSEKMEHLFFFEYDKKENELEIQGMVLVEGDSVEKISKSDAEDMLESLFE